MEISHSSVDNCVFGTVRDQERIDNVGIGCWSVLGSGDKTGSVSEGEKRVKFSLFVILNFAVSGLVCMGRSLEKYKNV
jgi:hypothetical protein